MPTEIVIFEVLSYDGRLTEETSGKAIHQEVAESGDADSSSQGGVVSAQKEKTCQGKKIGIDEVFITRITTRNLARRFSQNKAIIRAEHGPDSRSEMLHKKIRAVFGDDWIGDIPNCGVYEITLAIFAANASRAASLNWDLDDQPKRHDRKGHNQMYHVGYSRLRRRWNGDFQRRLRLDHTISFDRS
ncbi:hypothetical protein BD410DRAFT_810716 [Rickenella mellea]|uniref:Uncharacterized protein n=1 Tax=Rickenella mellea TaxID=50990 RepID=A0A4Y7PDF8_9AGAM|nr:hypothetical protein BD410DRAFT_810716 [Rickenella mellea]